MPFQSIQSPPWKGLNDEPNPATAEAGELTVALNVWRRGKALGTRPGTAYEDSGQEWEATVADSGGSAHAGTDCHGLVDVADNYDATRFLLAMFNGEVFHDHDVATANNPLDKTGLGVGITAGKDNWWTFAQGRGTGEVKLYGVGGLQAGGVGVVDDFWSWDLDVTSALADVGATGWSGSWLGARYIISWANRGFICGMKGDPSTDDGPMMVRYSALGDMDTWPAGNVFGGTSAIGGFPSEGSEYTTGFSTYADNRGSFLIVWTNLAGYSVSLTGNQFYPFALNDKIATGTVSQRAVVNLGQDSGDILYLSNKGIHSLRQSQQYGFRSDRFISDKIRETFKSINFNRIENAVGAYDDRNGVVVWAVPTGSNTTNDTVLVLDVRDADLEDGITAETARWYVWKLAGGDLNALISARDRSSGANQNKSYLYGGNHTGSVFRFQQTDYRDLASTYSIDMASHWDDFGAPSVEKTLGDTHLWVGPTSNDYTPIYRREFEFGEQQGDAQFIDLNGPGAVWDSAIFDTDQWASEDLLAMRRKRLYTFGSGEVSRWRITHSGSNEPVYLSRVFQEVDASGDELGNEDAA